MIKVIRNTDFKLVGEKIKMAKMVIADIDKIIEFECSNKQFVHQYTKEKHISLLIDPDCLHFSIRRIDNDKLVGHMILFGLSSPNKVLEFRRITINENMCQIKL